MAKGDDNIPSMLAIPESVLQPRRRRFLRFNRSPLARKIVVFNLIALSILVTGVLYLNQSDDGRVSLRRAGMLQEVEILAVAISQKNDLSDAHFSSLAQPLGAIVHLYDADGLLIKQQLPSLSAPPDEAVASPQNSNALTNIMQGIWKRLSVPAVSSAASTDDLLAVFDNLVQDALKFPNDTQQSTFTNFGDLYVTVAAPIMYDGETRQVVLISTIGGEMDALIRAEREHILQIFVLAIFSSIVLSMVLANSIARPLRRLADAADTAHDSAGKRLNPAQIQIPDLTARPDEIGDLSRAMRSMIEALFDRIDENKNFAADVSHEIKNPLTSLRSAVETLNYPLEDSERAALFKIIQGDVDRLDRLVTDISNASRLEGELVRDVFAPVDLGKLLASHIKYHSTERPDLVISLESDDDLFQVNGLEGRLAQVFVNLITNAMGFVPKDGWIKVSLEYDGPDMIVVRVTDNGPGIPADNLEDVFQRFYSERPERQFGEHSGLGLAISKQIIEAHNGEISVRNMSPTGGAQFVIRLPV